MENEQKIKDNSQETVTISRDEYDDLQAQNTNLQTQVNWLMEQLRLLKKQKFGASSEQIGDEAMEQLSLTFNEAEAYKQPEEAAPQTTPVTAHTRKKNSGSIKDVVPENAPVVIVEKRLCEEERICEACGTVMQEIGKEIHSTLVLVPAHYEVREEHVYTYACQSCKETDVTVPVKKAERTAPVVAGGFASPEAIAHILTQKFVLYVPLYRQEQDWNRQGLKLSRQTMSNWVLKASADWLSPVYDAMQKQLARQEVLHADETTLQVLQEPGKKAQSKSYMWLYRTSGDAKQPIVLYRYAPNRKAENPTEFLAGFKGYLHTDGYSGYHKLPDEITVVGCWAHARRKFDEALNSLPQSHRSSSPAAQGIAYCSALFKIEEALAKLPPTQRYEERQKQAKSVLDAILAWAQSQSRKTAPKSAMGTALTYLLGQWDYLCNYLKDGRLELSNNRAERSIKPFVMGRKNFLFANTPKGAQSSAIAYSMIETAKENGLEPFKYLAYVLSTAPSLDFSDADAVQALLPWNAPAHCRAANAQPVNTDTP